MENNVIGFFHAGDPYGEFSNWYMKDFIVDGKKFVCVEQYMMYQKAMLFGDVSIAEKILKTNHPGEMKELGRKVGGFVQAKWDAMKIIVVHDAVYAKFSQNNLLKKTLLSTKDKILAEASPYDSIWGVLLDPFDDRIQDMSKWKGQNLLGIILMIVRSELKRESGTN